MLQREKNNKFFDLFSSYSHIFFLIFLLAIYFFFSWWRLYNEPPVWPDEAIYASIVENMNQNGKIATQIWSDLIPGVQEKVLWNPPLYFIILRFWGVFFGNSLESQRLLSIIFGALIIIFSYVIGKLILNKQSIWLVWLSTIGIALDFHFRRGARLSRPEPIALALILLACVLLLKSWRLKNFHQQVIVTIFAGFIVGISSLLHPLTLAIIVPVALLLLTLAFPNRSKVVLFFIFLITSVAPFLFWLTSIIPVFELYLTQMTMAAQRKSIDVSWITIVRRAGDPILKSIIYSYISILLTAVIFMFTKKDHRRVWIFLITLFVFLLVYAARMEWYMLYFIPFLYLSLAKIIEMIKDINFRIIGIVFASGFIMINGLYHLSSIYTPTSRNFSYYDYTTQILEVIPDHTTVYLSAIPDPYFGFKRAGRQNTLYEFPMLSVEFKTYLSFLESVDYIVYTGSLEASVINPEVLSTFITENQKEIIEVGEGKGYKALVVKLK